MSSAAVILAAGAGTRFTGRSHKLLALLDGRSLIDRAVASAHEARIGPVLVIAGALDPDTLRAACTSIDDNSTITLIANPNWEAGQSSSLLLAAQTAAGMDCSAIVVALGDQPHITPTAWRAVAASNAPLAVADYNGHRGHPVRIHADLFNELPSAGDVGARELLQRHVHLVEPVPCAGSAADIDTVEELEQWPRPSPTNSP